MTSAGVLYAPFSKLEISGKDGGRLLDRLLASSLPAAGRCKLAHYLTPSGTVKGELVLCRTGPEAFYAVSSVAKEYMELRDLEAGVRPGEDVRIADVTCLSCSPRPIWDGHGYFLLPG